MPRRAAVSARHPFARNWWALLGGRGARRSVERGSRSWRTWALIQGAGTCVNGGDWVLITFELRDHRYGERSVGGLCNTGGAKIDRIELPGKCSTYLPPSASSPRLPEPDFELKLNPEVLNACLRAVARDQRCQETTMSPDCERYAQIEAPQAADAYDRIAATACGTVPNHGLENTKLGDTLCAALGQQCCPRTGSCDDEAQRDWCQSMNEAAAWLREDVQHAASACLFRPNCDDLPARDPRAIAYKTARSPVGHGVGTTVVV